MLNKVPKTGYKRILGLTATTVIVAEGIGLIASYGLWSKLNSDRDFRLYMHKNYNWVLDGYYGIGEQFGGQNTREVDHTIWSSEGKI